MAEKSKAVKIVERMDGDVLTFVFQNDYKTAGRLERIRDGYAKSEGVVLTKEGEYVRKVNGIDE